MGKLDPVRREVIIPVAWIKRSGFQVRDQPNHRGRRRRIRSVLEARNGPMATPSPKQGVPTKKTQTMKNHHKQYYPLREKGRSTMIQSPTPNNSSPRVERQQYQERLVADRGSIARIRSRLIQRYRKNLKVRNRKKKGKDDWFNQLFYFMVELF